ncbi:1,4-dihydroxy-2-naphthoate prenyltransferase [Homoserinibacter sp. GY 40078]|nr:1,4-dihydroxy-2-naphthoate prenyltransferase [Homoserinibacter sp. GY 40078]
MWLSTHPGPTVAVTVITVLLGVASGLEWWRILLLGAAMLTGQASVGISNDAIDAERDKATGRTDKPVARGELNPRTALIIALVSAALALVLTAPLGPAALTLHTLMIAIAWGYNAIFKSTLASPLPYLAFFGLLPALATLAADEPGWPSLWVIAAGGLLGVAASFANVLPDLDDDRRTGIRGLGQRLGGRGSAIVAFLTLGAASAALAVELGVWWLSALALLAGLGIAVAGLMLAIRGRMGRVLFRLVIAGALVDVVLLVIATAL